MRRCLCNAKPQKFDISNKLIMGNMADLVVRELWGAYEHQHKQRVMQLIRVVGCYSEPLLFVEVSKTQPWMILHLNEAAVTVTGEGMSSVCSLHLESILDDIQAQVLICGLDCEHLEEVLTGLVTMCRLETDSCYQQEILGCLYWH